MDRQVEDAKTSNVVKGEHEGFAARVVVVIICRVVESRGGVNGIGGEDGTMRLSVDRTGR